jgi:hypothetical protein
MSVPQGLLVGHLITRLERARAGLTCIDRLCIHAQNPGDPLKPDDFKDYEELCEHICGILQAPWEPSVEPEPEPTAKVEALEAKATRPIITGKYCR